MGFRLLTEQDVIQATDFFISGGMIVSEDDVFDKRSCEVFEGLTYALACRCFRNVTTIYRKDDSVKMQEFIPKGYRRLKIGETFKNGDLIAQRNGIAQSPQEFLNDSRWERIRGYHAPETLSVSLNKYHVFLTLVNPES